MKIETVGTRLTFEDGDTITITTWADNPEYAQVEINNNDDNSVTLILSWEEVEGLSKALTDAKATLSRQD